MAGSETWTARATRRARWRVRETFGKRAVHRTVQGVDLLLPWSHRLPDYARLAPDYGQNLVRLAIALRRCGDGQLRVLDVGANVGDSTCQIVTAVDARVLCVEADSFYLEFLHANVGSREAVTIEHTLLAPADGPGSTMEAVRRGGTSHFIETSRAGAVATCTPSMLRSKFHQFQGLDLIKSDTDGHDVSLIPALAKEWSESRPVLFFEYDHDMSARAGHDARAVWEELADLGYEQARVWWNTGQEMGETLARKAGTVADVLDDRARGPEKQYWDVAMAHRDDADGLRAVREA